MQYLGREKGENSLKAYLAFRRFLLRVFSLLRASGILYNLAWRHLLVQDSFRFPPEFRWQFQCILSRKLLSWNPALLLRPEFGIRSPSSHGDLCPENSILYPYFRWRKECYFRFRVLANHLASFFFLHMVRRFIRTTICPYTPFFIHPVTECNISWLSLWPGYFTSAARNWPLFLIPLLTVSLWWPVNSNTEG